MKYEEIKIGESYSSLSYIETVIFKHDKSKSIVCEDQYGVASIYGSADFEGFKPLKKELPEEGLLVSEIGSLAYRLSGNFGYGFGAALNGEYFFSNNWSFSITKHWQPATPEQEKKFIEMLKKQCEKRGLFEDTKIECHADEFKHGEINDGEWIPESSSITSVLNYNGQIFYKGNFATPRKESTLDQVTDAVKDIADFTIEETESKLIILTPIKK